MIFTAGAAPPLRLFPIYTPAIQSRINHSRNEVCAAGRKPAEGQIPESACCWRARRGRGILSISTQIWPLARGLQQLPGRKLRFQPAKVNCRPSSAPPPLHIAGLTG